jgi:serine/threonine protein kinase
MTLEEVEA